MDQITDHRLIIPEQESTEIAHSRIVVTVGGDILPFIPERPDWPHSAISQLCDSDVMLHFVGCYGGQGYYTYALDSIADGSRQASGLRGYLGKVPDGYFRLLGRALQLNNWFADHRFCGNCGAPTRQAGHEHAMRCDRCEKSYYPRLSPCVMALVVDGDRCLLARNARWKRNYFSTVAGFIEAGETAEDAVHREVLEEVGVRVDHLRYVASQPWPFPGQLMIGFVASYCGGDIKVDGVEIAEAHWFDRNQLPAIPDKHTLSGRLIRAFAANQ